MSSWKGQSRVLKKCHWCAKKQEPLNKPFQACAKCKEVIYCSKECQVASWPLHKAPCKLSADAKKAATDHPGSTQAIAVFKKWHSLHLGPLRHAAICALNLGENPAALNNNVLFVKLELKADHINLPTKRKYEPTAGFVFTMDETRQMLGNLGGDSILDNFKEANEHIRKKGGLGVVALLLQAHDAVDIVKIILPSPLAVKQTQKNNDWGDQWMEKLRAAVELD